MVNTQESASQAKTISRDAECGTKVMVESKGQQKNNFGEEKNIQCLIIKPEDYNLNVTEEPIGNFEDLPECFKCEGKKVNKKGLPCKKCNGTGKLNNKFFKNLQQILSNEVSKVCTSQYQKLLIEHLEKKKADQAKVVHNTFVCDGCNADPIIGIRYKCTVRPNYDLCEKCEARIQPPYPMLKIRHPSKAPAHFMAQYANLPQMCQPQPEIPK